jgi:hypothetical protein
MERDTMLFSSLLGETSTAPKPEEDEESDDEDESEGTDDYAGYDT